MTFKDKLEIKPKIKIKLGIKLYNQKYRIKVGELLFSITVFKNCQQTN